MRGESIGLAVIGCGTVGRIRAVLAREHPAVDWIGLCDIDADTAKTLGEDVEADIVTTDLDELLARPEVTAVIVATAENEHVAPILASVDLGKPLFIEKPLATDPVESARVLEAIEQAGIDAVMGYTQRFRRRFQTVKQRLRDGQIGEVTSVVTRAFMNRMVPDATLRKTSERSNLTPMVVSGTHSLDMSLWLMEGLEPVAVYAASSDKVLGGHGTKDATCGVFTMENGAVWSMSISWALPVAWPGAVYGLEIGIVGTRGVIDVEDTHRDLVLASEIPQSAGYRPEGFEPGAERHVDFLTSYPPGDVYDGQLWGPMREETNAWLARLYAGLRTPHATAADGHRNLVLTMARDLAARRGEVVKLPVALDDLEA
jgi:predicted dehydrogenase